MYIEFLQKRELLYQNSSSNDVKKIYCGFDATAISLQIGNLIPIISLKKAAENNIETIALLGGATTQIGDPTDRTQSRKKISQEEINNNISKISTQIKKLLPDAKIVNNLDWISKLSFIDFLNDVAPYVSAASNIKLKMFAKKLENNLPFNVQEFLYPLLQGYDFLWLYENMQCNAQIGGQDQWCNILTGLNLIEKKHENHNALALTLPLLTNSKGEKMGKSQSGAIYIDPTLNSSYEFWQYWRNIEDSVVATCLKKFTNLPTEEIESIQDPNKGKIILANELTTWIHSPKEAQEAETNAKKIFVQNNFANIEEKTTKKTYLFEILTNLNITSSNSESKRLIKQNAVKIDQITISDPNHTPQEKSFILSIGKKHFYKINFELQ